MTIEGPIKGTKTVVINPSDNHKTRIDVVWNIKLAGILRYVHGYGKKTHRGRNR